MMSMSMEGQSKEEVNLNVDLDLKATPLIPRMYGISSKCSVQGHVFHSKRMNLGYSSAEGRSSTANSGTKAAVLPGIVVASRCFLHPPLSLSL